MTPLFVGNGGYHLQAASPAIDTGTNDFPSETDFDGVARPVGNAVDIGPYEFGGTPTLTLTQVTPDVGAAGQTVTLTGNGFVEGATATFGEIAAKVDLVSTTEITAVVPDGNEGSVDVHAHRSRGDASGNKLAACSTATGSCSRLPADAPFCDAEPNTTVPKLSQPVQPGNVDSIPVSARCAGVEVLIKIDVKPSELVIGSGENAIVTVQATDAADQPIPDAQVELSLSPPSGQLSAIENQGDGTYTAGETPGTVTLTATTVGEGKEQATIMLVEQLGPPDRIELEVPQTVERSKSIPLTVRVFDRFDNPISNAEVQMRADRGTVRSPAEPISDKPGVYTTIFRFDEVVKKIGINFSFPSVVGTDLARNNNRNLVHIFQLHQISLMVFDSQHHHQQIVGRVARTHFWHTS